MQSAEVVLTRISPTAATACSGGTALLVVAVLALLSAQVLPPAHAISWLALRHSPLSRWNSSSCRLGRVRWGLSPYQAALCRGALQAMPQLARAAQLAVTTCKQLFADRRWDCSSLDAPPAPSELSPDLSTGTREQAFVHALSSAAVTYALARACAQGALPHCACAGPPRDPPDGNFKWGGCGDNVRYGALLARQFADAAERRGGGGRHRHWTPPPSVTSSKRRKSVEDDAEGGHTPRRRRRLGRAQMALVNLHNNRAGRRAVESSEVTQCKCHGVSGSCNIKTCWRALPRIADIGLRLQRRAAAAVEVVSRRRRLLPAPSAAPTPSRPFSQDDLIFLTKSPDYCLPDARTGSRGTHGRSCNATSVGFDSCQDMCCGRGFRTVTIEKVERCQCKYYWCCYVRCKTCASWIDVHECL